MASLSGRKALGEIDRILKSVRGHLSTLDGEYGSARAELARLRSSELAEYAELAKLRLLSIEQGDLVDALDEADREARRVLDEREETFKRLESEISAAEAALDECEARREAQRSAVAAAGEMLDKAEAAAQASLRSSEAYQAQFKRTEDADFIADQAEEKAAAAQTDRIEKGEPYMSDPLFSYLWARGYGTSQYRAFPLIRWLDGKVAKLCKYEPARRNYALLTEIPPRLREHAATMRAAFDTEAEALADLEQTAAEAAGVPASHAALDAAEKKLAEIDGEIVEHEERIRDLVTKRSEFASGNDALYRRCIDVLSEAMQRRSISFLRERAARTVWREDDEVVRRLAEIDAEADRIERNLEEFRQLHDNENGRLNELEDLRRRFKSERYDEPFSEFKDWALIALVLREFLRGAAGSRDVWKTIERQQRTKRERSNTHFGSLKFPRAPKPGPWRMPKGGFGGGFRSGGGFKGGGFKTGGGFRGGGGFKTGGGF